MQVANWARSICLLSVLFSQGRAEELPVDPTGRLNEQNLARVCDNRIASYLRSLPGVYQLTLEQEEKLKTRLQELKRDQIRYSLTVAEERARLVPLMIAEGKARAAEAHRLQTRPSWEGAPMKSRLDAIQQGEPLFSEDRVCDQLEKMLPEAQAKAGRARLLENRAQFDAMMMAQWHLEMLGVGEGSVRLLEAGDQWTAYVEKFCARLRLNDHQRATAASILRDVLARRDEYILQHQTEMDVLKARAKAGDPHGDRPGVASQPAVDRYAFFAPVENLWAEMRSRLDAIPTTEQVEAAQKEAPTISATRPTEYVSGSRPTRRRAATQPAGTRPVSDRAFGAAPHR